MPGHPFPLVIPILLAVLLAWLVLRLLARRLKRVSLADWVRLGSPTGWGLIPGTLGEGWQNWISNFRLMRFAWTGEHVALNDRYLTTLIWLERMLFVFAAAIAVLSHFSK
jgi:hypothetical protein